MGKETDEDEIWNYKSSTKGRAQANKQSNVSGSSTHMNMRRKSRKQDEAQKNIINLQADAEQLKTVQPADSIQKNEVAEVIDVDLEIENDLVALKVSGNRKTLNKEMNRCNNSVQSKNSDNFSSGSIIYKTNLKSKVSKSKKLSNNKTITTKLSPSKSSRKVSLSCKKPLECSNIDKYFSPTKDKGKTKRKSSESVDNIFDFTDDELMFVQENVSSISETGEKVSEKPLKIISSQNHYSTNLLDCSVKSDNSTEKPTVQENMLSCFKNIDRVDRDNAISPKKDVDVNSCGHDNEIIEEMPDNLAVSVKDDQNLAMRNYDSSLDNCLESVSYQVCCDTSAGGFLADEDAFGLHSSIEDDICRDNNELHMSSSSSDCTGFTHCILSSDHDSILVTADSLPSIKTSSLLDNNSGGLLTTANNKHDDNGKSSCVQNNIPTSPNKHSLLTAANKQTSIFSFFKAKFGSGSKVSQSLSNKFNINSNSSCTSTSSHEVPKVTARPNLYRGQTTSATAASSSYAALKSQKQWLQKSSSTVDNQTDVETEKLQQGNARVKKQCPFYKKIPNTSITVDAFSYGVIPGCEVYVLTHFHCDHYGGLTKRFAQPIFCSQATGNLVEQRLGVNNKWINRLPMWKPCQVAGVTLTLMEANHCPGAVMILFELKDGRKHLHTGDFRACPDMEEYPMLKEVTTSDLYLDTTYCNPSYTFPTQSEVINCAVSLALAYVAENPHALIVCGTYTIGKEKIFTAIARALNSKICVTRDKKKVLDCLDDKELQSKVTLDWSKGQVHVLPMGKLTQKALFEHHACHPQFKTVLAIEPTGWTYSGKTSLENISPKWSKNGVTLYGLPYSEHSSYLELKRFIQFLRPKKIIPTVNNGKPEIRKTMEDTFAQWMRESRDSRKPSSVSAQQRNMHT
uniref:DNA cross-link repair 1A protein n=1 Tax=Arion vulgaris TaxID=1028688 RepID=A0A0B7ATJ2_9EUPU